jgi:cysteine synthase A
VKLEGYNPAGSSKDRPAVAMLRGALADGRIAGGSLVIEASSGNTGVALAKACAVLGLRFRCLVDPGTTRANLAIMRAYGAEVEMIDTPDADGEYLPPKRSRIRDILAHDASAFWPDQYANPANPESHAQGTIREILNELGRAPDALFVATSTCGTLRGCMETLKAEGAPTRVWAVDAAGSQIFRDRPRPRRIPGLGSSLQPDFAPSVSDVEVVHVETTDCVVACRRLAAEEGILAGGSSGAVVHAIGRHIGDIPPGSVCVGILPDRGDRYLDTVYDDDWLPGRAAVDREVRGG